MRFKLFFKLLPDSKKLLPYNYQHELSEWIYQRMSDNNAELVKWLHKKGMQTTNRNFNLFTFSNFIIPKFKLSKEGIQIQSNSIALIISFYPLGFAEHQLVSLFKNQVFELIKGDISLSFVIHDIEKKKDPVFQEEMVFKTLSPILVAKPNPEKPKTEIFLSPDDDEFEQYFIGNLIDKYVAFCQYTNKTFDLNPNETIFFKKLNVDREKGISMEEEIPSFKLKCYELEFLLKAPKDLIKFGYFVGFGDNNHLGLGCCEYQR